jgi:mono/diheme cytochrome c family protein
MSRPLRIVLTIVGALLAIVVIAGATVYFAGGRALARTFDIPTESFTAPTDSASIAAGERLAQLYGCRDCHVADLGGQVLIQSGAFGIVPAPNLTAGQGGVGATYSDTDYERAIRHGARPNGQSLVIMPSADYQQLTDEDVGRIIAYVRQAPAVGREAPARRAGPIMRMLLVMQGDQLLQAAAAEQTTRHPASLPAGPTVAYGRYMAAGCRGCHGPDYSGGPTGEPGAPPAANITPDSATGIGAWTRDDFDRAVRTGRRPDGRELSSSMPSGAFSVATDDEVTAMWLYLRTVPAVAKQMER